MKKGTILIIMLLFLSINSFSQSSEEIEIIKKSMEYKTQKPDFSFAKRDNKNEIEWLFAGAYLFYKHFFSRQDANSCTFHPSCSTFALQSIKKHGAICGVLAAFDRLSRCNGLSPELYDRYKNTPYLFDPVE